MKLLKMKTPPVKAILIAFGLMAHAAFAADTLVVDKVNGPYKTIQAAVDAANPGDTVFIRNGVYDTDGKMDTFVTSMSNRVFITKSLTLEGESKEGVIVKGAHATVAADTPGLGLGTDAVRCIGIKANDVVIKKMTITGGATHTVSSNDACEGNGGGIYCPDGYTGVIVADCIISNNVANRAAGIRYNNDGTHRLLVARCWFHNNRASNRDPVGRGVTMVHSLITTHPCQGGFLYALTAVNCTFADNRMRAYGETKNTKFYNCIFADSIYRPDYADAWYYNCAFPISESEAKAAETSSHQENCVYSAGYDHFMAPILHDYRLHAGASNVIGKGKTEFLENSLIAADYRYTDFFGNAISSESDTLNLGCAQVPVTPVGGMIKFAKVGGGEATATYGYNRAANGAVDTIWHFNDDPAVMNLPSEAGLAYYRAESWPTVLRVRSEVQTSWKGVYGLAATGADTVYRYPLLGVDTDYEIVPPMEEGLVLTLTPQEAKTVVYVDQDSEATPADGSEDAPYTDLQEAIDACASGTYAIIYSKGGTFTSGKKSWNGYCRIYDNSRNVRIVGLGGPSANVIVGEKDPEAAEGVWPFGCGENAARCVCLNSTSVIQGFTLTYGHTTVSTSNSTARRGAGIYLGSNSQAQDCVITNNWGCQGVAINGQESGQKCTAYAFRCLIDDNHQFGYSAGAADGSGSGIIRAMHLGMCICGSKNTGCMAGFYDYGVNFNCTFHSDSTWPSSTTFLNGYMTNFNAVVYGPTASFNNHPVVHSVYLYTNGAITDVGGTNVRQDPLLADPANGDYRVGSVSAARTAGAFDTAWSKDYHIYLTRDIDGRPFRIENGKPFCGAVHACAPTVVASGTGIDPSGTVVVASGVSSVTFTATAAATRPYIGFLVNDETQKVAGATYELPIPAQDDYSEAITVSAIYDTNWYVDPAGDDGNVGTAESPKKTLKGGLTHAIAGDTVHAAAGTYETETMIQPARLGNSGAATVPLALESRAYVPDGVTLLGAGAAVTTIRGAADPEAVAADNGCGTNAIRCVALGKEARIAGFTLADGHAYANDCEGSNNDDNHNGGGVLAYYQGTGSNQPVIEDCVITNCAARRGGGAMNGAFNRCRFLDCKVSNGGNGPAARGEGGVACRLWNCYANHISGYAGFYMVGDIRNCTIGADYAGTAIYDCQTICNSLFLGSPSIGVSDGKTLTLTGCAYGPSVKAAFDAATKYTVVRTGCVEADRDSDLAVTGEGIPVIDSNLAIDAATAEAYDAVAYGSKDVDGRPRFTNGLKLDIGAVEADWRGTYAKALGPRVIVTVADGAVERIDGKVTIPSGATLAATVGKGGGKDRNYVLTATVGTDGFCAVAQDGADLTTLVPGPNEARFTALGDSTALEFAASGLGSTVIDRIRSDIGSLLILR